MKKSMLSTKQSYALCAIGVLVLFGILVAVCETGAISLYVKGILMTCCIAVIMTTSLNLTIGVLGQLTLGCCGFEAIGAYSAALMSKLLVANGVQMMIRCVSYWSRSVGGCGGMCVRCACRHSGIAFARRLSCDYHAWFR